MPRIGCENKDGNSGRVLCKDTKLMEQGHTSMVPRLEVGTKWIRTHSGRVAHRYDEIGGKGCNTDIFRIDFAMDSREGHSKFFKGVT